jgi:hypothetical protein
VRFADYEDFASEFEISRKAGTGTYAVVYLVREVISPSAPSEYDNEYPGGSRELDNTAYMWSPTVNMLSNSFPRLILMGNTLHSLRR